MATALGLVTSSAVLVHLSGGTIEAALPLLRDGRILTLYQDWLPFLVAIGYVVVHHGVLGRSLPSRCTTTRPRSHHPLRWALIHGGFVLAASVASIVGLAAQRGAGAARLVDPPAQPHALQRPARPRPARAQRHRRRSRCCSSTSTASRTSTTRSGHAAGDQLLATVAERLRGCHPARRHRGPSRRRRVRRADRGRPRGGGGVLRRRSAPQRPGDAVRHPRAPHRHRCLRRHRPERARHHAERPDDQGRPGDVPSQAGWRQPRRYRRCGRIAARRGHAPARPCLRRRA